MFKAQFLALFLTLYVQNAFSGLLPSQRFSGVLTPTIVKHFRDDFNSNNRNILSQNETVKKDPLEVYLSRKNINDTNFIFQYEVNEVQPATNQRTSGACWIFAALNVIRIPFMEKYNLKEFEFSQAYLFFWHKIERSNFFLHNIVNAAKTGRKTDGRLMSYLLSYPVEDGGHWDMAVNLINRYGLVPKSSFPTSWTSNSTRRMNLLLESKLREYSKELIELVENKADDDTIERKIEEQMNVIFRIVGICLGVPSETITWEYYDTTGALHRIGPITGLDFYRNHVKQLYNVDEKVSFINDPRPSHPFGKLYEVGYMGNSVGGHRTVYNNQPAEVLMKLAAESIKNNESVWFSCDEYKRYAHGAGIRDINVHDMESVFGTDIQLAHSKADRIIYRETGIKHVMVFHGVSYDANGNVTKFKVENSQNKEKRFQVLTADWFKEFVFEVVVDKKFVPADVLDVFKQKAVKLPLWDPLN